MFSYTIGQNHGPWLAQLLPKSLELNFLLLWSHVLRLIGVSFPHGLSPVSLPGCQAQGTQPQWDVWATSTVPTAPRAGRLRNCGHLYHPGRSCTLSKIRQKLTLQPLSHHVVSSVKHHFIMQPSTASSCRGTWEVSMLLLIETNRPESLLL